MNAWQILFFPFTPQVNQPQQIADILTTALTTFGYKRYDPFTALSLEAFPKSVRLFISPVLNGSDDTHWIRVNGEIDPQLLPFLSQRTPFLLVTLTDDTYSVSCWERGQEKTDADALTEYLRAGRTLDDMIMAMNTQSSGRKDEAGLPTDALPEDIQQLAGGVDMKHASKLFSRLSETLSGKVGADSEESAAARKLLRKAGPDWSTQAASRLMAVIATLSLPGEWRSPDFVALRDAYALYKRFQRNPNAILLPGDKETMDAVPNALDFVPIYGGKTA